jgi:hypothetical protein
VLFVSVPFTITVAAAAGAPLMHSSNTPAALAFWLLLVPVTMALSGAMPVVVLVHLSVGILNFEVTLVAVFGVNIHPPNPVRVAFARLADLTPGDRGSLADGPLLARAGPAALTTRTSDPRTATPVPVFRTVRIGRLLLDLSPIGSRPRSFSQTVGAVNVPLAVGQTRELAPGTTM